jgi:hypothetical protein
VSFDERADPACASTASRYSSGRSADLSPRKSG